MKQNRLFISVVIIIFFIELGYTNTDYAFSKISPELLENATTVIREKEVKCEIKNESTTVTNYKIVYTVLEKKSENRIIQLDHSDLKKIDNISVKIYNKEGNPINTYKKKDFINASINDYSTFFSNFRTMYLDINELEVPLTIELQYQTVEQFNFFYPDFYLQDEFNQSVENNSFSITIPKSFSIKTKKVNTDIEEIISGDSQNTTYSWTAKNLKAFEYSPYNNFIRKFPCVLISPDRFVVEGIYGSMSSWALYSKFIYDLNKNTRITSPAIKALVLEITKNSKTDKEKIASIYNYIQKKMRYVNVLLGIGGFRSHDAQYVHKNSFGDCKALSNFTQTLLSEAGIESHWALIYRSTSILPMIYDDFVSPRFNHAIIYIPKENLWLECTSKNLPLGYIGVDNMDRKALVIKENDGYLADTPKSSMFENKYYSESEVVINDNASAKISIQFEYSGTKHDNVRYYIDNLNDLQKEKYINGLLIVTPQAYETIEMKFSPDTPKASIFTKFDIHKIGNYSGNRLFFNTNSIEKLGQIVAEDSLKSDTFELNNDYEDEIKITYHLPQKFVIENVPYKEKIKQTPFLEYYSKVEINDSKIIFYRKCKFIKGKHNKELFKEYANTLKEVNKWENSKIVLSPNR